MISQQDILNRLKSATPSSWFGDGSVILDSVLNAFAWVAYQAYCSIEDASLQLRLKTATGPFLDLFSFDFFGMGLSRKFGESDTGFRSRIIPRLFREKGTRDAISNIIFELIGVLPVILEPRRIMDTAAYNINNCGYGVAGRYGSLSLPFQCFVDIILPASASDSSLPFISGYGIPTGGYSTPSRSEYTSLSAFKDNVQLMEIYNALNEVKPVATTIWVTIKSQEVN